MRVYSAGSWSILTSAFKREPKFLRPVKTKYEWPSNNIPSSSDLSFVRERLKQFYGWTGRFSIERRFRFPRRIRDSGRRLVHLPGKADSANGAQRDDFVAILPWT